jgi:hypothetical protein
MSEEKTVERVGFVEAIEQALGKVLWCGLSDESWEVTSVDTMMENLMDEDWQVNEEWLLALDVERQIEFLKSRGVNVVFLSDDSKDYCFGSGERLWYEDPGGFYFPYVVELEWFLSEKELMEAVEAGVKQYFRWLRNEDVRVAQNGLWWRLKQEFEHTPKKY